MDDLLPALGEFGCYQKLLLWFICLPACIPCGFCAFNQLFMTDTPDDYWCNVPQLNDFNLTIEQIRDLAIPSTEVVCFFIDGFQSVVPIFTSIFWLLLRGM